MLTRIGNALEHWRPSKGAAPRDPIVLIGAGWREIVGDDVAAHSHPTHLGDGTLSITTVSSAWSHQLSMLSEEILRAVCARLPGLELHQLRFRVGKLRRRGPPAPSGGSPPTPTARAAARTPATSVHEAVERFRADVDESGRAKRSAGWKDCKRCGAFVAPGTGMLCTVCENALQRQRADDAARLLYEAPWLGYAGTAALVDGLSVEEYESIRTRLLSEWWQMLSRARAGNRLSADARERSIASSYVILRSKLPPEAIAPATVRNVLGDELHDLIYGTERD